MAYRIAREAFIPGGVNRVILATDGDFNVGITSPAAICCSSSSASASPACSCPCSASAAATSRTRRWRCWRTSGNGHYAYLDSLQEARRVLVREGDATLETVAKDVKFQVEFNPAVVSRVEADRLREPRARRARLQQRPQGRAARWAPATP